jgi:excisionase family DNA binding protein
MPNSSPPLGVAQAANQVGIPTRTLRYAILHGDLPAHKLPGRTGAYLIDQRDLDEWFAKRDATKASA